MATMRRDQAEDNRHFDTIEVNRKLAPETQRLADILSELAETMDASSTGHFQLHHFAGTVQGFADKGEKMTADETLTAMTMALRVLGLLKGAK